ncbi:START domain-containing protein [Paraglaciecola marina]|uniref:START domain-containing protein n=1 Tax=Paraglaciecola marina TaxID=2500157 RepID=UPI001060514B|nr:START domain-containing protein [Paraglaciecola marina]
MQCSTSKTVTYLILLICAIFCSQTYAETWDLKKQKHNVSVYSQKTASGYNQVLATTQVHAHPLALIALFDDIEACPEWIHNCIKVEILEKVSATESLVNTFFGAPWPVKDRDMVTYSTISYIEDSVIIELTDKSSLIPAHPKFVRMKNMQGTWKATPISKGVTEISYQGGGDPGGKLPAFLANRELVDSLYNTLLNLQNIMPLDKYQPKNIQP